MRISRQAACRADISVRCFRLPRLIDELVRYNALHKRSAFLRQLARLELLGIDAILDRLVYNAYKLNLKGGSMRKAKANLPHKADPKTAPRSPPAVLTKNPRSISQVLRAKSDGYTIKNVVYQEHAK